MVDKKIIRKVATISRIHLSEEEIDSLKNDFAEVMDIFSEIDKAEVDGCQAISEAKTLSLKETSQSTGDEHDYDVDEIIRLSPHRKGRFIKGPKV
ncbi:MAG: aspartyl/glutamyl-tRNA amidotransferase subunit C [Candidatus Woesearchaeota archaeon]